MQNRTLRFCRIGYSSGVRLIANGLAIESVHDGSGWCVRCYEGKSLRSVRGFRGRIESFDHALKLAKLQMRGFEIASEIVASDLYSDELLNRHPFLSGDVLRSLCVYRESSSSIVYPCKRITLLNFIRNSPQVVDPSAMRFANLIEYWKSFFVGSSWLHQANSRHRLAYLISRDIEDETGDAGDLIGARN